MDEESTKETKDSSFHGKESKIDKVSKLNSILTEKKREFAVISKEIFLLNQEFNSRNENSKHLKASIAQKLSCYVQNITEAALNESELLYQKEVFDNKNGSEIELASERSKEVKEAREELERILAIYRDCRRNILSFQENVTKVTDQSRMDALNSVTFLRYAQSSVTNEIHKISENSYFPTKKETHALRDECIGYVDKSSKSVVKLYQDKMKEYRRQERILTGRRQEINDLLSPKDAKHDHTKTHVIDCAQLTTRNSPSPTGSGSRLSPSNNQNHIQSLDGEYSAIFPEIHSPDPTYHSYNPPVHSGGGRRSSRGHSGRKQDRHSAFGEAYHLPHTTLTTAPRQNALEGSPRVLRRPSRRVVSSAGTSAGITDTASRKKASRLFDASLYTESSQVVLQTGTLLADEFTHSKHQLQESDDQLCSLALQLAQVEGKQKQLMAIREGLDVQLMKQSHLALSLARDLHADLGVPLPHAVREHFNQAIYAQSGLSLPVTESGRTLRDIYFDQRRRLPVEGAVAGVTRYTFDPTSTVSDTLKDVRAHHQLLDGLDHQTKTLLKIDV